MPLEIRLDESAVVDQRTGVVAAPSEYVDALRALEVAIARADDDILTLKADLKMAREAREKAVAALRAAVRDGKVLPLLEAIEDDAGDAEAPDHAD